VSLSPCVRTKLIIDCRTSTVVVSAGSATAIPTETTASSAIKVTTTNASGQTVTSVPATITSDIVTTSNGQVFTVTQVVHNPTGSLDQGSSSSGGTTTGFFANHGAVAGVFVVVGLVVVGMIFVLGLLCFRRRRRQRLDREVTAAAIAASSSNAHRSPIDEADDMQSSNPTSESYPSTVNAPMAQYNNYGASYGNAGGYDPYAAAAGTYGSAAYAQDAVGGGGQAGYEGLHQGDQGYYYDPREAQQQGMYPDEQQGHPGHGYDDPYGGYSGGEGSLDTPTNERENPLHVSIPSQSLSDRLLISDRWQTHRGNNRLEEIRIMIASGIICIEWGIREEMMDTVRFCSFLADTDTCALSSRFIKMLIC